MRFIADVMLGSLAKWLRIMGYDVLYSNKFTDKEIMTIALSENRVVLTRDKGLSSQKKLKDLAFYVNSSNLSEQIFEVISRYKLDIFKDAFIRCIRCNHKLEDYKTAKDEKADLKKICPHCKRLYWKGSHVREMLKTLRSISDLINSD